jgi:hypothetical protein
VPYPQRSRLFENFLAIPSVNLISGSSGAGKTRFLFGLIEEIERYGTLLGMKQLKSIKSVYFALDRPKSSAEDTLNSMQCELRMPIESKLTKIFPPQLPRAEEMQGYDLVVIDGLDFVVRKIIDSFEASKVMHQCLMLAEETKAVIIGMVGSNKVKNGDGYTKTRDKSVGSGFFARSAEDVISIDYEKDEDPRQVSISLRNGPPRKIEMIFDERGRLVPSVSAEPVSKDLTFLNQLPDEFSRLDARMLAENMEISSATMDRIIARLKSQGFIKPTRHGYSKIKPS